MMNTKWLLTTAAGAILGALVVYQVKKHTKGILDDE
jgi:hypothetical protein